MTPFLERMRRSSIQRLERAQDLVSLSEQRRRALEHPTQPFPDVRFAVIAEVKPSSPSEGSLGPINPIDLAVSYQGGGAAAVSVLTEPTEFGGSLRLLGDIAASVQVPVLRKDFIVDPYQVWEARAHGADGALLIARMLDRKSLRELLQTATEAGLFVLLEAFDVADLELIGTAVDVAPSLMVGVNSRDLTTLEVRRDAHAQLAPHLPSGPRAIAESGIDTVQQVGEVSRLGYDGVLVGTALMRAKQPEELVREMISAAVLV